MGRSDVVQAGVRLRAGDAASTPASECAAAAINDGLARHHHPHRYRHCLDVEWRLRQLALFPPLFKVQNGLDAPPDAYVSVRYRNARYWIDDRDQQSKSLFNSILLLFSLTETAQASTAPVVTIPVK
jgi:hypothetical protein